MEEERMSRLTNVRFSSGDMELLLFFWTSADYSRSKVAEMSKKSFKAPVAFPDGKVMCLLFGFVGCCGGAKFSCGL